MNKPLLDLERSTNSRLRVCLLGTIEAPRVDIRLVTRFGPHDGSTFFTTPTGIALRVDELPAVIQALRAAVRSAGK